MNYQNIKRETQRDRLEWDAHKKMGWDAKVDMMQKEYLIDIIEKYREVLRFYGDEREMGSIQHAIWAHWMKWMFSCGSYNEDGDFLIPFSKVHRWSRQMETGFDDLFEKEQQSDIDVVNKHHICDNACKALKLTEE